LCHEIATKKDVLFLLSADFALDIMQNLKFPFFLLRSLEHRGERNRGVRNFVIGW